MLIVVAGMVRSGSTWMYNVIRIALIDAGITPVLCLDSFDCARQHPDGVVLVKSHLWRPARPDLVFTSSRDQTEVRQSWARVTDRPFHTRYLSDARRWRRQSDYHMPYQRLLAEPLRVTGEIIETLQVNADPERVLAAVDALEPPTEGQDPVTRYWANHRAGRP